MIKSPNVSNSTLPPAIAITVIKATIIAIVTKIINSVNILLTPFITQLAKSAQLWRKI